MNAIRKFFAVPSLRLGALALLLGFALLQSSAYGDDRAAMKASVQDFYKRYTAEHEAAKWLAKSDLVTHSFKVAYAAYMKKEAESDPVLQGQDFPESGYVPGDLSIKGEKATLIMRTRDSGFPPLTVHLVHESNRWLIDGVNNFKGK